MLRSFSKSTLGVLNRFFRSVISCVTGSNQLLIFARQVEFWCCCADLSSQWLQFWRRLGLQILEEDKRDFIDLSTNVKVEDEEVARTSGLSCSTVQHYFTSIAECSFVQSSWSKKGRCNRRQNCLLAALHRSGTMSFWDVTCQLVNE